MNPRILLFSISMALLGGCSSVSSLLRFEDSDATALVPVVQPMVAAAAPDDTWCQRVAASERLRAQGAGYDAATLDRMTLGSFQQCRLLLAQ